MERLGLDPRYWPHSYLEAILDFGAVNWSRWRHLTSEELRSLLAEMSGKARSGSRKAARARSDKPTGRRSR